ncbi:MAG: hypothetical protein LC660_08430 [Desulfobacteraceae bacterium]|nr:hypothetical protein [Desulfobacteraceae bacterium]
MKPDVEVIQAAVINLLHEMTEDWGFEEDSITSKTFIVADLSLSSIDGMHLFSSIDMHFNIRLQYEKLIMVNEDEFVPDLTVQQIVQFVFDNFDQQMPDTPQAM